MSLLPKPKTLTSEDTKGKGVDRKTEQSRELYDQVQGTRTELIKNTRRANAVEQHQRERKRLSNSRNAARRSRSRVNTSGLRYGPSHRGPRISGSNAPSSAKNIVNRINKLSRAFNRLDSSKLSLNRVKNEAFGSKMPKLSGVKVPSYKGSTKRISQGFKMPKFKMNGKKFNFKL